MNKKIIGTGTVLVFSLANIVKANDLEPTSEISIGLGRLFSSDFYIGNNDQSLFVPLIGYKSERFSIDVLEGASYNLYQNNALSYNLVANPRFTTLDEPDSPQLQGIDRKTTLDAGVGINYTFGQTFISASTIVEITGQHNGLEIDFNTARVSNIGALVTAYGFGISWHSKKLSGYQYSVHASEALDGRPEYSASTTIIPYTQFIAEYQISSKWKGTAGGQLLFLTGENKRSPIVSSSEAIDIYIGIISEF